MLVEFRVSNYRSFEEEQVLSMVASKDDAHPGNLIECDKFNLLKATALFGANASGKSNLLDAFTNMVSFIRTSASRMTIGDRISEMVPFRLDAETTSRPCRFAVTIIVDGTRYEYGFAATSERVVEEWLYAYPPSTGRKQRWLERKYDSKTGNTEWNCRSPIRIREGKNLEEMTRDNGLALSRGAEQNIKCLSDVYLWFSSGILTYNMTGSAQKLLQRTVEMMEKYPDWENYVLAMTQHADLGIEGISVENMHEMRRVVTTHRLPDSDSVVNFDMERDESEGTKRFFALAIPFSASLGFGILMVIDELDCSLHPLLVRKLIELFQSPEMNKNGAQIIFTTHDSTMMDSTLFRRDQICLVEKNQKGASEVFSLYDIDEKPRSTTALQRNYLAGRYGAVPSFGPTFEDLEIK
jgi:uncharacterized protein